MPDQNGDSGEQGDERNPLRRFVDVPEQDEFADSANHAECQCAKKQ
jgi:hypothetical protein